MKINSAILQGAEFLKTRYISSANLDSEILMAKVINKDRKFILLNPNQKLTSLDFINFKKLIKKRSLREPVAYLINKKFFWNSEFFVTKNTLIPRPDTETLIDCILNYCDNKNKLSILDIGIGSGCILLSILKEKKNFLGSGIDISKEALNTCKINAINLGLINRLKLFKTDVDKFIIGKYDLIVSNPPYIKKRILKYLEKDVIGFEPKLALNGGKEGLSIIRKVIERSSRLIKKNGILILEIGHDQKKQVKKILMNKGFFIKKSAKDLAGNDRCIISLKI